MKILVAIPSDDNAEPMANLTLRWAARAGFNMRIFVPDVKQKQQYVEAIADANHNYYLNVPESVLVFGKDPEAYAKRHGYDALVLLPDHLYDWDLTNTKGLDKTVVDYAEDIGRVRKKMSQNPEILKWEFDNGTIIERL